MPSGLATDEDVPLVLQAANGRAITIVGPDGAGSTVRVTLSATSVVLSLARRNGLTFYEGDGREDRSLTFTGSFAGVNASLDGPVFPPVANAYGIVTPALARSPGDRCRPVAGTEPQPGAGAGAAEGGAIGVETIWPCSVP